MSGTGDNVYVIWDDGHLVRVNTQDLENPKVVEEVELLGQPGVTLRTMTALGREGLAQRQRHVGVWKQARSH